MPTQIEGGTAAVGVFCFEDNGYMSQCQCKLRFPTAELTFWWPEISWKPSSAAVKGGGASLEEKICFLSTNNSHKRPTVFVDIPYVIGCGDVCES